MTVQRSDHVQHRVDGCTALYDLLGQHHQSYAQKIRYNMQDYLYCIGYIFHSNRRSELNA